MTSSENIQSVTTAVPDAYDRQEAALFGATVLVTAILAMVWYALISYIVIEPSIQALYLANNNHAIIFALTHAYDARQYVFICAQGYSLPTEYVVYARTDWMPVYAALQCSLHGVGVSLVYTGWLVSIAMIGVCVTFASLILRNFGIRHGWFYSLALLSPIMAGAWLYLAGVEATFLAVGMVVLWLITLPEARTPLADLRRAGLGLLLGITFIMTKPNAIALMLPLVFAFFYQSWQRSQRTGYAFGFWTFTADVLIEHLRPVLVRVGRLFQVQLTLEDRPIVYDWTGLAIAAGIGLGLAYWLWFSSDLSGVPLYFLQSQSQISTSWPAGNLFEMTAYFLQMFRGWGWSYEMPAWRYNAAWNLAVNLSAVLPAASNRVPLLIRGMLLLTTLFTLYTGAVWGSTRYVLSTAVVAIGWACWLAPIRPKSRWPLWRIVFLVTMCVVTSVIVVDGMMPVGEPGPWGVVDR